MSYAEDKPALDFDIFCTLTLMSGVVDVFGGGSGSM